MAFNKRRFFIPEKMLRIKLQKRGRGEYVFIPFKGFFFPFMLEMLIHSCLYQTLLFSTSINSLQLGGNDILKGRSDEQFKRKKLLWQDLYFIIICRRPFILYPMFEVIVILF
jgi:hypothetical protein